MRTKVIGRQPTDHGPYDPQFAYGKKFIVTLFDCGWESKHDNNTSAPATLNAQAGTITENTTDWKKVWGSYKQWLIDNGYQKMDASKVKDGNNTQHDINAAFANEIGSDSTPESIKGRVTTLEGAVGTGGSVDERIATEGAKHYLKSETYTKEEVNGMITTPDQGFVSVSADAQTTAATDVLPATGEADTIYRVANWDGSQYDTSVYSEYSWNTSTNTYIKLSTKQVGIDNVPTAGSDNLVKSGGVVSMYGHYDENPDFSEIHIDKNNRILFGVKKDGDFFFGAGVPSQIKDYMQSEKEIIHITNISVKTLSNVQKIGDIYFNTNDNLLHICTAFVSDGVFDDIPFEPSDSKWYELNGVLYRYNGTTLVKAGQVYGYADFSKGLYAGSNVESTKLTATINGKNFADELKAPLCDFTKSGDMFAHTSSFVILNDVVYSVFMVNYDHWSETPSELNIRLQSAPLSDPTSITYYDISEVGDTFGGKEIQQIYDSVIYEKSGILYIIWNAQLAGEGYSLLYKTYNPSTGTFSQVSRCNFSVNGSSVVFERETVKALLESNDIKANGLTNHLILMPKISYRIENGITYYYTGLGCGGSFNCIVKSSDFINWEYVAAPDFYNEAAYEPAVYVVNDMAYYYCRQTDTNKYGFLTRYSLISQKWENPVFVEDAQSRPDFIYANDRLYLIYAPKDRNHIAMMIVDSNVLSRSFDVQVAFVGQGYYPFSQVYNNEYYMIYTQNKQHIYLSKFTLPSISEETVINKLYSIML